MQYIFSFFPFSPSFLSLSNGEGLGVSLSLGCWVTILDNLGGHVQDPSTALVRQLEQMCDLNHLLGLSANQKTISADLIQIPLRARVMFSCLHQHVSVFELFPSRNSLEHPVRVSYGAPWIEFVIDHWVDKAYSSLVTSEKMHRLDPKVFSIMVTTALELCILIRPFLTYHYCQLRYSVTTLGTFLCGGLSYHFLGDFGVTGISCTHIGTVWTIRANTLS